MALLYINDILSEILKYNDPEEICILKQTCRLAYHHPLLDVWNSKLMENNYYEWWKLLHSNSLEKQIHAIFSFGCQTQNIDIISICFEKYSDILSNRSGDYAYIATSVNNLLLLEKIYYHIGINSYRFLSVAVKQGLVEVIAWTLNNLYDHMCQYPDIMWNVYQKALEYRQSEILQLLTYLSDHGYDLFCVALKKNNLEQVEYLISIEYCDSEKYTNMLAEYNHFSLLKLAVDKGAPIYYDVITYAVRNRNREMLEWVIGILYLNISESRGYLFGASNDDIQWINKTINDIQSNISSQGDD